MDLHKLLARDIRSKAERDEALKFLRAGYAHAVAGTEWEGLFDELKGGHQSSDTHERLELYEVEDRPVGVVWPDEGMGSAWVWHTGAWRVAPGLVNKSWLEGQRLARVEFERQFPDADLGELATMIHEQLGYCVPASPGVPIDAPFAAFDSALRSAVGAWAREFSRAMAADVREELLQLKPSGIFDRDDHHSVWDELCLQAQHGPPQLESAWDGTVDPLIDFRIDQLKSTDAALLTLWSRWQQEDLRDGDEPATFDLDAIRRLVRIELNELADENDQDWVTG